MEFEYKKFLRQFSTILSITDFIAEVSLLSDRWESRARSFRSFNRKFYSVFLTNFQIGVKNFS